MKTLKLSCSLLFALVIVLLPAAALGQAKLSAEEAVEAYASAWNVADAAERRALLEKAWTDDGVYTDPTAEVKGREALLQHIAGFQAQGNGAKILRTSKVDSHHGTRLRFSWKMVSADGQTMAEGIDYGELAEDGRLKLIVGFFGPFAPLEE